MALDTYSDLKTAIADHLDRSDLTAKVDDFIDLAEARHKREIRTREMLSRSTLAIADGDRYVSLPADFLDIKYLRILIPSVSSGIRYFPDLVQLSPHELTKKSVNDAQRMHYFSVHEQIEFDSEADQAYTGELFYYVQLTALSDDDTTNSLLTRAPDAYLYAALLASAPYLKADERLVTWANLYRDAKESLNTSQIEGRHGGPMLSRVVGSTP